MSSPSVDREWIPTHVAARLLGVHARQVRAFILDGDLVAYNAARSGAQRPSWRIDRESVFRLINERTRRIAANR